MAVYDERLARLKDLRKRQNAKVWMTDEICDYLDGVIKSAYDNSSKILTELVEKKLNENPSYLIDKIHKVIKLAGEILANRYDYLEY